jgi:uncharacterized protein CbrC (UPF0167 family)
MTFKYFDRPDLFVGLRNIETVCDTCRQSKFCFDAEGFYGSDSLASICPECLAVGKLSNLNSFTCDGDVKKLVEQLKQLNPGLTYNAIQDIANAKTIELEKTTPNLATWQDWRWPCSEGDYCKFIGYGSKPLYRVLATDIQVEDFFKDSFYEPETFIDYLWSEDVPDKPIRNYGDSRQYSRLFYVFQSLKSDKIVTIWDCD